LKRLVTCIAAFIACLALLAATATHAESQMTTPGGVKIDVVKEGQGVKPTPGHTVVVHYTGMLTNGKKFDSSRDRGEPFSFPLGAGQVIKGWDEAFAMMKVGTQARITIPPAMGYGARGAGGAIPPNATLIFDVELLGVK
jgi:peptidylprolyl isomerase